MSIIQILTNLLTDAGLMGSLTRGLGRIASGHKRPHRRRNLIAPAGAREEAAADLVKSLAKIAKRHERHQDNNLT